MVDRAVQAIEESRFHRPRRARNLIEKIRQKRSEEWPGRVFAEVFDAIDQNKAIEERQGHAWVGRHLFEMADEGVTPDRRKTAPARRRAVQRSPRDGRVRVFD